MRENLGLNPADYTLGNESAVIPPAYYRMVAHVTAAKHSEEYAFLFKQMLHGIHMRLAERSDGDDDDDDDVGDDDDLDGAAAAGSA